MKYQKKTAGADRRLVLPSVGDRSRYSTIGSYSPARIGAIMRAANGGDVEQLCLLGRDILERNWDVIGAMEQRSGALCGCNYRIEPGGESDLDKLAAEEFEKELAIASCCGTFYDLLQHLVSAVVLPFAPAEIIWQAGGKLAGFQMLEPHCFNLRDGFVPRLICDEYSNGLPEDLQENRIIFHQFAKKGDPARAGKIRVLAWLHCFQNWPIKDLFSFIERFGMPFLIAKVDQNTWESEREVLHSLIRNFGPNGGGVFTKSTELELLNAANTGSDNVYFRTLEFCHNAIYTLLVGQLASSGESSGLSGGDAQSKVRQDILEADAHAVEATVRSQIAKPWIKFNYPEAAIPKLLFELDPPEDQAALATMVATLSGAGYKADPTELSERLGLKLRYEPPVAPMGQSIALAAEKTEKTALAAALDDWLGPIADEIASAADLDDATLDQKLRNGFDLEESNTHALEKIMTQEMESEYANQLRGK